MSLNPARRLSGPPVPDRPGLPWLVVVACLLSLPVRAETVAPIEDWRQANETVGRFERGHIDLLRWEAEHLPTPSPEAPAPSASWTLHEAIVAAQRTRPDLLAQPGLSARERAQLQLRQRELALQVERAWLQAIAARHAAATHRQVLEAALAGHELALRMARVGNWPQARQQRESLLLLDAQAQWQLAEHAQRAAVIELWRLTGAEWAPEVLAQRLPADLPAEALPPHDPPTLDALEQTALDNHPLWRWQALEAHRARQAVGDLQPLLTAIRQATAADPTSGRPQPLPGFDRPQRWPHAWDKALQTHLETEALERRIRADVRIAHSAWQTAQRLAQDHAAEAARLHTALEEDMLQRYNGMFKSTWDLLAAARARLQAVNEAQQARLGAALAWAELRAVLDGLPYTGAAPRSTSAAAAAADQGH